jgi:transposase
MGFQELTDEQWAFIAPLLPPRAKTGRPRVDDRKVLNGILYVRVTGCRWCDMPRQYGAYQTAWRRFRELQEKGVWHQILQALLDWGDTLGKVKVEAVAIDSTRVEAKKGGKGVCPNFVGPRRVVGQLRAVVLRFWDTPGEGVGIDGHERRKGTKARVWVNEDGLPLRVVVGPGNAHDRRRLEEARGACGGSGGADAAEGGGCGCGG